MKVEFHFDFGSPNCHLAHLLIPAMEARTGVAVDYVPILLGGLFKATGNASPMQQFGAVRGKLAYMETETARFIRRHGIVEYAWNPDFPINTLALMRGAVFAKREGFLKDYADAVFRHMWAEPKKMDDPGVIAAALAESGLPAERIFAGAQDPEVKAELIANTERSVAMGNFGAPTLFVDDEMFFGKDKLWEAEEEIMARKG